MASLNDLVNALGTRLEDPFSNSQWSRAEALLYVKDALRFWNAGTGYWKQRDRFTSVAGQRWYDLTTVLAGGSLARTVTDSDLLTRMNYMLCEDILASAQFPAGAALAALERRQDQFLGDTACVLTGQTVTLGSGPVNRATLPAPIIDIRRMAYVDITAISTNLSREDEFVIDSYAGNWQIPSAPTAYAASATPPFVIQLAPAPSVPGELDVLSVNSGPTLTGTGTVVGVPDDFANALLWGALADLLGSDTPGADPFRAQYCESRYKEFVVIAKLLATALRVQVSGQIAELDTVTNADQYNPGWENVQDIPISLLLAGPNIAALNPVSAAGGESITVDLVSNAQIPSSSTADLSISSDLADVIVDYAEHTAMFKLGGEEFGSTEPVRARFMAKMMQGNAKLAANADLLGPLKDKARRPRVLRPTGQEVEA